MGLRFGLLLLFAVAGCSSVKTTFMSVDSNGCLIEDPKRCVQGVPAMISVPSQIEVKIIQTDYWKSSDDGKSLTPVPTSRSRDVEIKEISVKKMVMIDPKRPASGSGEFKIKYAEDGTGTIEALNYKAVDETLKNSAALVAAAMKVVNPTGRKAAAISEASSMIEVKRDIAVKRFPIDR